MPRVLNNLIAVAVHAAVFLRALCVTCPVLLVLLLRGRLYGDACGEGERRSHRSGAWLAMLSFVEWDGAWQRPQHLAQRLLTRMDVVCCAPVRAHNLPGRALALFVDAREQVAEGLAVLRPLVLPAETRFGWVRRLNGLIVFDAVRREIVRRGSAPRVLLTNSPFFTEPFTWLPAGLRAYDVMDELIRFKWAPPDAEDRERQVVEQADVMTTGTLSLARLKRENYIGRGARPRYVPCGVDSERFSVPGNASLPDDVVRLPRPVIGYFGAVNERVDPSLLRAVARAWPTGSVVLVGPVYGGFDPRETAREAEPPTGDATDLRSMPNVHFLGLRPYEQIPLYLAAFDCALVPYRLDRGVEFVQPVKVLEYLAGGKPVVSTPLPDVQELYSDCVRTAAGEEEFVEAVRRALGEGATRRDEYRARAAGRSWETMADEFADLFDAAYEGRVDGPRNVAHLLHGTHFGGAEEMALQLCRHYDASCFRGAVVSLDAGRLLRLRAASRGVSILETRAMRGRSDLAVVGSVVSRLRQCRADLIHTHSSRTNLLGRLAASLAGLPTIATVHTAVARDLNDPGKSNRVNAWVERLTRRGSARLVTVSARNRREALDQGDSPARVLHIPNGVEVPGREFSEEEIGGVRRELGLFGPDDAEAPVVGMLASLRPRKGPEVLLRAMPKVLGRVPEVRLLMVGSAEFVESMDYLARLRALADEVGLGDRVVFAGHRDDTDRLLRTMDVVCLPSLFGEGLPLALLEAMARGRPVVASNTEGNDEVVSHAETGLLVPAGDPDALADALVRVLQDRALATRLGRRGRVVFEQRFTAELMARAYESVYRDVLGPVRGRGA